MRAHAIAVVTGAVFSIGCFFAGAALAQNAPVQPAVQDVSIKPIGKVVTATGSVTIEHVTAVVVQATLGNQPGQAKVGDSIYLGMYLRPGPMAALALRLLMGLLLICPAMPAWR